jgi:hypothetical protein
MLKVKKIPGINGYKYKQQYAVVVICDDESHQKNTFQKLSELGFKLKVVVV